MAGHMYADVGASKLELIYIKGINTHTHTVGQSVGHNVTTKNENNASHMSHKSYMSHTSHCRCVVYVCVYLDTSGPQRIP